MPTSDRGGADAGGWLVLLLGGASGVGKTRVSYPLARHFGVSLVEVDDFQAVLERMTTRREQPELHYFRARHDEWRRLDEEGRLAHTLRYGAVMADALEAVIANHLEGATPLVLEGDFILPSLAVRASYGDAAADGRVRAVFLYEPDEAQLARNYLAREGREQAGRARASWRYSEWLRREAARLRLPAVAARPWGTVLARCIAAVDGLPLGADRLRG
jgi:2-phosphoglycerate kinase